MTDHTDVLARAAHEMNLAYCIAQGDYSHAHWDDAPEAQKESARMGVASALAGNTPEQQHESWAKRKLDEGWTYGPTKDMDAKTHPALVPYRELSAVQKKKDQLFIQAVRAMADALGVPSVA
jgi:hypothetical protein